MKRNGTWRKSAGAGASKGAKVVKGTNDQGTILHYYSTADETNRLASGLGVVEFARTKEIIKRYLPPPPRVILDVGGGSGPYSRWLAREGYEVHLVDVVPALVEEAQKASARQPNAPVASIRIGDARALEFRDGTADAVLLLGPLYHLVKAADRLRALREARRVLKPRGLLFAVGISRFASALEAVINGLLDDREFIEIVRRDLASGQHRNPTANLAYFTDAYFHAPGELEREVRKAGLAPVASVMVDSLLYAAKTVERSWQNEAERERLMEILRRLESEPSLMGAGPHLMCVARKEP